MESYNHWVIEGWWKLRKWDLVEGNGSLTKCPYRIDLVQGPLFLSVPSCHELFFIVYSLITHSLFELFCPTTSPWQSGKVITGWKLWTHESQMQLSYFSVDFLSYLVTVMESWLAHARLMYLEKHVVSSLSSICSLGPSCVSVLCFWWTKISWDMAESPLKRGKSCPDWGSLTTSVQKTLQ